MTRSRIAPGAVLKNAWRLLKHPWIVGKLAALESEKWLLNLRPPRASGQAQRIRQLSLRLTDLCNLRCGTCGQWGERGFLHGRDLAELRRQEVPVARYLEILEDLTAHGHRPLVYLWGGEPMLYEGVLSLIEGAARLGLPVSIATNGTMVARAADRLAAAPLFLLQVSIDGHTAELHNRLRPGVGGTDNFADLQKALAAVRRAREARGGALPLIASLTVISRENYRYLADLYDAFRSEVDLFVYYLSWWIDEASALEHDHDFARRFGFPPRLHWGWVGDWKPGDYGELARQLSALRARSRPWSAPPVVVIPDLAGPQALGAYYTEHQARFGFDRCVSIYQVAEVDSNGNLSPCRDYHDYVVGNLKEATLTELWNAPAYQRFRQSLSTRGLMPVCARCCGLMGY